MLHHIFLLYLQINLDVYISLYLEQMSAEHLKNSNYIEAIEALKEENGDNMDTWTKNALCNMALAEYKLNAYESAYTYYLLAENYKEASNVLSKIRPSEIEREYSEHIAKEVKIMKVNGLRGVQAIADLPMNFVVFKIPLSKCITGTKKEMTDEILKSTVYSHSLPKKDVFPVCWDSTTCDQIGISPLRLVLESKIHDLKKECKTDDPKYLYHRSLVSSRCFADPKNDKEYLVPFADMLNHSNDPNVEWEFREGYFIMTTIHPVKKHTQLCDYYGPKSNYESFLHYGFVQANNTPLDVVRMIGELPDTAKSRLDPRYFQQAFEFELRGSYMEGTVEIFSFLRYVRSNEKKCPETLKGYFHKPISIENELWVCKMLYNMLQKETYRRVSKSAYGIEETLAIELLQSEMGVLVHWGGVLTDAIKILEGNKKLAKKSKNDYIVKIIKKLV